MSPEPITGDDPDVLVLAALIAAGLVFCGPLFVRTIRHKNGDKQHHWVNAGPWEIAGLGIIAAILIVGMGRG
jgi:hypothetical protein